MDTLRVIMLGTGTSHGVPMIGCDCAVCTSPDPRDTRTRTSIAIQWADRSVLIDTPPELRLQCIANNVRRADAILLTHHHADHLVGLDDVRRFNALQGTEIMCYGLPETLDCLMQMFGYAFVDDPEYPSSKPHLGLQVVDGPFELFGRRVTPIPLLHGPMRVLGYRFGRFAYCTDCSQIPDESWALLEGLDVLVLDGLRRRPHPTHFNLDQAVEAATRIAARLTYFTHIAHELKHAEVNDELPDGMELAYDGQIIDVPWS
jgi:phosphoribosyl 1,2-cyclic phosphate phosphodiesterase